MIAHGPVDVVVLAFAEPKFEGGILAELETQVAAGTIKVLDAIVLMKDGAGDCWRVEIGDLSADQFAGLAFIEGTTAGLFDDEDVAWLCEGMVSESAIAALAIEHTWAVRLVNAISDAGGEVAFNARISATVVDEAFEAIA